jgi:mono/diheme cytochrome c family protein
MKSTLPRCLVAVSLGLLLIGCEREPVEVSYSRDVRPILEQNCASCHVPGQAGYVVSGFELRDYDSLMKGTQYGPVVLPGDPLTSTLVMLIEGRADPALNMPHGDAKPLSPTEIQTIRAWVEQGAKNN